MSSVLTGHPITFGFESLIKRIGGRKKEGPFSSKGICPKVKTIEELELEPA